MWTRRLSQSPEVVVAKSSRWVTGSAEEARRLIGSLEADLAHPGVLVAVPVPGRSEAHVTLRAYPIVGCLASFVTREASDDPDVAVSREATQGVERTVRLEIDRHRVRVRVQARQTSGAAGQPVSSLNRQTALEVFASAWVKGLAAVIGGTRQAVQRPDELQRLTARPLRNVVQVTGSRSYAAPPDAIWQLLTADSIWETPLLADSIYESPSLARWRLALGPPSAGDLLISVAMAGGQTVVPVQRYEMVDPRRAVTSVSLTEDIVVRRETVVEPSGTGSLLTRTWQCRKATGFDFRQLMDASLDRLQQRLNQAG